MIYILVTRVIQYFCFPDRPVKGGDILDFYKGGILEKERYDPLTNYDTKSTHYLLHIWSQTCLIEIGHDLLFAVMDLDLSE